MWMSFHVIGIPKRKKNYKKKRVRIQLKDFKMVNFRPVPFKCSTAHWNRVDTQRQCVNFNEKKANNSFDSIIGRSNLFCDWQAFWSINTLYININCLNLNCWHTPIVMGHTCTAYTLKKVNLYFEIFDYKPGGNHGFFLSYCHHVTHNSILLCAMVILK